jgi:hypothetical protein
MIDGVIKVWNVDEKKTIRYLVGHGGWTTALVYQYVSLTSSTDHHARATTECLCGCIFHICNHHFLAMDAFV